MRVLLSVFLVLNAIDARAQADLSIAKSPNITTQVYKCRQATDLAPSALPGYLQLYAGGDPQQDAIHFNTREISTVTTKRSGVQINFVPRISAEGLLEAVILVPLEVQPQAKTVDVVRTAIERAPR